MTDGSGDDLQEARPADGMTLAEIAREIPGASEIEGDGNVRCMGVHHDSRRVQAGDLFVVRRGEKHDGSAFVTEAISRGAVAVLAERHDGPTSTPPVSTPSTSTSATVPVLRVDDVSTGLAYAAAAVYGHPAFALDIVGVTGTNGKTTTTHIVRAAIDGALGLPRCGIVGTIGHTYAGRTIAAAHTTPEADELARVMAVMRKRGATHVAMEVSSIALVLGRVKAVRFRVAAFTNLTQDHLDFHGSMDAYAAAKMSLFTTCQPGLAVVNVDDPFGVRIAAAAKCKVLRVRTKVGAEGDIAPVSVEASASGMRIVARVPGGTVEIASRLVGLHNLENLLVAIGVASALELEVDRAAAALATEIGAPGRLERCDGPGDDLVVLVDYAHTPDALARVLDAVREVSQPLDEAGGSRALAPRLFCVFGCGGDRDAGKRGPMGEAVGARADIAIITNDNPRTEAPEAIAEPVEEGVRRAGLAPLGELAPMEVAAAAKGYMVVLDRQQAIALAIAAARPGDVVLVAGKGHEDYQIVGTTKRAFDDRVEARNALQARRGV
jgi:UDP-N-acetylmuramoyl-L-alanyl-D-glutamate--2,6-diaminopimelate ligase